MKVLRKLLGKKTPASPGQQPSSSKTPKTSLYLPEEVKEELNTILTKEILPKAHGRGEHIRKFFVPALKLFIRMVYHAPASEASHGAYDFGLLLHSLRVARTVFTNLPPHTAFDPSGQINRLKTEQLKAPWELGGLLAGLLHDIGKVDGVLAVGGHPWELTQNPLLYDWMISVGLNPAELPRITMRKDRGNMGRLHVNLNPYLASYIIRGVPGLATFLTWEILRIVMDSLNVSPFLKDNLLDQVLKDADRLEAKRDIGDETPMVSTLKDTQSPPAEIDPKPEEEKGDGPPEIPADEFFRVFGQTLIRCLQEGTVRASTLGAGVFFFKKRKYAFVVFPEAVLTILDLALVKQSFWKQASEAGRKSLFLSVASNSSAVLQKNGRVIHKVVFNFPSRTAPVTLNIVAIKEEALGTQTLDVPVLPPEVQVKLLNRNAEGGTEDEKKDNLDPATVEALIREDELLRQNK